MNTSCPCCSGKTYALCCEPLHLEKRNAHNAEELMRSRYTAFAKSKIKYLLKTTHPNNQNHTSEKELLDWSKSNTWNKLEIISRTLGGEKHTSGIVEFKAYFLDIHKTPQIHHEVSNFIKLDDQWYYTTGNTNPKANEEISKTGRNDACPCGSGKKFKKCCGKL